MASLPFAFIMSQSCGGHMTVVLAFVLSFLSYLWIYRWRQRNQLGPKNWPFLGASLEIKANFPRFHDWMYDYMKMSPTATILLRSFGRQMIFIGRPDNVEHILKNHFPNYIKGRFSRDILHDMLGDGIFNSDGEVWKQHRKIASLEFSSEKLRDYSTVAYRHHCLRLLRFLDAVAETNKEVDIQDLFLRMTMDSICKIGFGLDLQSLSASLPEISFCNAFDRAGIMVQHRQWDKIWKLKRALRSGSEKESNALFKKLDEFTFDVIKSRRKEIATLESLGKSLETNDLLSRYMSHKDENGKGLSDRVLRDAVLNFIIAGRDTSAITLAWFVYCLHNNPEVVEKINEELDQILGEKHDTAKADEFSSFAELLTYESLRKLHYLHAALTETLRLYPVVPKDSKYAVNDDVLPDGTIVKSGDRVVYSPYVMGRLESLWGSDALEFRPERWLSNGVFQPQSPYKFTAFQAGPRVCLGKATSYLQMKMTAALLLRFFRVQMVPNQSVGYVMALTMQVRDGLQVTVSRR